MFSQTLGTALGDWTADTAGLGYRRGRRLRRTARLDPGRPLRHPRVPHAAVLGGVHPDPPLGAVVGDFLDKPLSAGGMALSRYSASAALLSFMLAGLLLFRQRAATTSH